jgi:Uncharacterized protein conserved in bacteria C-term(DUF2220)
VIDPLAHQLLDELKAIAGRRKRLLAVECDDALLEVVAQRRADPDRRRRLLELLTVLRDNKLIEWSAARDRSVLPELPSFVIINAANDLMPLTESLPVIPWRPELEWIYDLRLTSAEHETLNTVNTYRRDRGPVQEPIPHRERSLQLFGDEKRLDRLVRGRLFAPGRLSLELLDAYWAAPPIAWTAVGPGGVWVVSENAASFHTLRRVLVDKAHAVAYGGGGAFAQSIAGLEGERILYVGDLDAEGLAIPQRAGITAELFGLPSPQPFEELWALLVVLADECGQPAVPVPPEVAGELCAWFGDTPLAGEVQRVLEAGVRVAQEALTAERLGTLTLA